MPPTSHSLCKSVSVNIDDVAGHIESLGGVLTLRPSPGDGTPEISWGDLFFYYAPDGQVPAGQPFATVVTKDYPGEPSSELSGADDFRVNIHASGEELRAIVGHDPKEQTRDLDHSVRDVLLPHPVYGQLGWVAVVNPAERSSQHLRHLLTSAHDGAKRRVERRSE